MDINVKTYQPNGTTLRETYAMAPLVLGDEELIIRNLQFRVSAAGGMSGCSLTIYKDASTVSTVTGDIIKIDDGTNERYVGKIESMPVDKSDNDSEYEDKTYVTGRSIIELADSIPYTLREDDGSTVTTDIQELLDDLFDGGQYTDKGQDNNQAIETALSPLLTYAPANNVLETLAINASFNGTSAAEVMDYVMRLNNGTLDLTAVEPYIFRIKTDKSFHTEQRVTTLLQTFDMDDGNFPTKNSVDLADDGFRTFVEGRESIANKFILNGNELVSLQYATEVAASRSTWGTITAPELNNENITVAEGQKWLDGFILDMLEPITSYEIRLRRSKYGFAPVWFTGSTDTTNGYIKVTEGGSTEVFNEPFIDATYQLDSGGWDITIRAGKTRPNYAARAEVLTNFTGLKTYAMQNASITDPSDTASDETFAGTEILQFGQFNIVWDNPDFPITAADVEFKIKTAGGGWWAEGITVKTLTSASNPPVVADPDIDNLFICRFFNGTSGTETVSGGTIYPLILNDEKQYEMWAEITIDKGGGSTQIMKSTPVPFYLTSEPTGKKARNHRSRMPDAETKNVVNYTPVATPMRHELRYFTDVGGDTPPDAGAKGLFFTDDSLVGSPTWTRITGNFDGTFTGTTSESFTVDSGDSSADYIYYYTGTGGSGLRYDIVGTEMQVNHDDGGGWVSLATGASTFIQAAFGGDDYQWIVNTADGSVKFIKDPTGTPETLFTLTATGNIIATNDIEPATDDSYDLGTATKKWANVYCGNVTYTNDIEFTPDGGVTTRGTIETVDLGGGEYIVLPSGIGFGFQDD